MKKILGILLVKKLFVGLLMVSLLSYEQKSYAQAVPVANFVVNRAIAGVVQRIAIARGFAANDPRIVATMNGIGNSSTKLNVVSTVAGVGLTVAGAPVWLGIAASLGVVALGYGITSWVDGPNGREEAHVYLSNTVSGTKLQVDAPPPPPLVYTPPQVSSPPDVRPEAWFLAVQQGAPLYRSNSECYADKACWVLPQAPDPMIASFRYVFSGGVELVTNDLEEYARWFVFMKLTPHCQPEFGYGCYNSGLTRVVTVPNSVGQIRVNIFAWHSRTGSTQSNMQDFGPMDVYYENAATVVGKVGPQYYTDGNDVFTNLPQQIANGQITPDTLARLVDRAWQLAAQDPDYQGLPYSATQPVQYGEAAQWANENPQAVPRVADLLSPASNPGTQAVPISPTVSPGSSPDPGTNPNPTPSPSGDVNVINTPNVNVVNRISVDFGADPGLMAPDLEETPEPYAIFEPVFQSVESFAIYGIPNHQSECPKPSFDMWGDPIVMDGHCKLLDDVKPTLFTVMAAVWVVIGCFIILAA
ncbi:hypothetical protein RCH14_001642 [Massilia sp. MP_M2]|uniref:hypothetical protein n=1 Tax=Massilia sp. MP_M2 TaxID=3071713 RepID=UPI00319E48DE